MSLRFSTANCPTLGCDEDNGEGKIKLKNFEAYYDCVFKLDVLGDWIAELQDAYDRAHEEAYGKK